jgi:hypothetical protein
MDDPRLFQVNAGFCPFVGGITVKRAPNSGWGQCRALHVGGMGIPGDSHKADRPVCQHGRKCSFRQIFFRIFSMTSAKMFRSDAVSPDTILRVIFR